MQQNIPTANNNIADPDYLHVMHAYKEYRVWRTNPFIGEQMGAARTLYLHLLKERFRKALKAYRNVQKNKHLSKAA